MSDIRAQLNSDSTIKAVLGPDRTVKAQINSGLTINPVIDGGTYIHFDVTANANNQVFTSSLLSDYNLVENINLMKNGVYIEPTNFTKPTIDSIQVNIPLEAGDTIDILATGSTVPYPAAAGSNFDIQYNNQGIIGANSSLQFDWVNSNLTITGNVIATDFYGNATNLTDIPAANISGQVANALVAGTVYTNAQPNITSVGTLSSVTVSGTSTLGNVSISGTANIQQGTEKVTSNNVGSTGTLNFDVLDSAILFKTASATGNVTLNVRGNSTVQLNSVLDTGRSLTCTFINTIGSTGYQPTVYQIDGANVTVRWLNGIAPLATVNSTHVINLNIIKTGVSQYTVLGSYGSFS